MLTKNWHVVHLESIDSTNAEAFRRAEAGASPGLVVVADYQSAGRGRLERTWESQPGSNLLVSLLFSPFPEVDQRWQIPAAVSLAMVRAVSRCCTVAVRCKWPNDLVVSGKKVAGVLTQMGTLSWGSEVMVVGIGVNCADAGPPGVGGICLNEVSDVSVTPTVLLETFLESLSELIESVVDPDHPEQILQLLSDSSDTLGKMVLVSHRDGRRREGRAVSIDTHGRLVIESTEGVFAVSEGDVEHLRPA